MKKIIKMESSMNAEDAGNWKMKRLEIKQNKSLKLEERVKTISSLMIGEEEVIKIGSMFDIEFYVCALDVDAPDTVFVVKGDDVLGQLIMSASIDVEGEPFAYLRDVVFYAGSENK